MLMNSVTINNMNEIPFSIFFFLENVLYLPCPELIYIYKRNILNISRTFIKTFKICIAVTSKTSMQKNSVFKRVQEINSQFNFFFVARFMNTKTTLKAKET